jgi:ABC-type multidrug transport system fused ATPase/permease subunit
VSTPDGAAARPRRTRRDRLAAIATGLGPFARPYRRPLASALLASAFLTGVQLAFPWPLKWLVDLTRVGAPADPVIRLLPAGADPVMWLAGGFAMLGLAFGLAEYWQRVAVARFVVPTVNDARLGLFTRFLDSSRDGTGRRDPGDVLTRMVTDTAKLRVGLKGLLVHLLQHGLFVAGVCVVLLIVDVWLGLGYLVGLLLAVGVALFGADLTAAASRRRRGSESRRVGSVLRATRAGDAVIEKDPARERADALLTQIKGRTAWAVQGVLAVTACVVLVLAVRLAESGRLNAGDVALVASYLLMLHYPMMRIGRQITRLGPQLTSAERLTRLVQVPEPRVGKS